jgi:hypothetical protein
MEGAVSANWCYSFLAHGTTIAANAVAYTAALPGTETGGRQLTSWIEVRRLAFRAQLTSLSFAHC